jgi:protein gp37
MSLNSPIEWTQATWNPTLGCSKCSAGCKLCYAIKVVHRLASNPNPKIAAANAGLTVIQNGQVNWTGKVRMVPARLCIPLRRKKPTTYFVNSLSDLFHPSLSDEDIAEVFKVMHRANWHRFQVLTKHGETDARLPAIMKRIFATFGPMPHVWFGVSVEDRAHLGRIDLLRNLPRTFECPPMSASFEIAPVRFLSLEPLLEDLGPLDLTGIHWVIVGGESGGKGARPMRPAWVRSIRDQCIAAGVPFFFKQWGVWTPGENVDRQKGIVQTATLFDGHWIFSRESLARTDGHVDDQPDLYRVGKKSAGRLLDGREWNEMPR